MFALLMMWMALAGAEQPQPSSFHLTGRHEDRTSGLDCTRDPCAEMLPGVVSFERPEGKPYVAGIDENGEIVGWVALSTDVVDIKAYSGKPLISLVGLDTEGTIVGARVLHHSEPILLVGIPESKLHSFVANYVGIRADAPVVVGGIAPAGGISVDVVSGATVTVLAQNQTLLETARRLGKDVGVIEGMGEVSGHFVEDVPWTWQQLLDRKAMGRLTVSQAQMSLPPDPSGRPFVDVYYTIADAPQVGIPLMGKDNWTWAMNRLEVGEHLFVAFNAGTYSIRGSGFVRGGIFDRFRVEQGLRTLSFRDMDYERLDSPDLVGAPHLWEGGLFVSRGDLLHPGLTYRFSFLGSTYATGRGAFERDFSTFSSAHRLPGSVYQLDGPDPEIAAQQRIWRQAWATSWPKALGVSLYMLLIAGLFVARKWTAGRMHRLETIHVSMLAVSFLALGLWLHVQPSVTQLLTIVGSTQTGWHWGLFLSDPVLFVSWIGIALVTVLWGRGVYCGWICPYGAMNELTFKLGRKLGLPEWELPDAIHFKARYLRYVVFAALIVVFLYDAELGERMAEVEPFKSTFFVPLLSRHWGLIAWWGVLFALSAVTYRPFCRYICPLGAALAVPSTFRLSGPYRRDFCTKCKICTKGCEPRAIRPDGSIDPRECLNCWECEANYNDDQVCPPLVKIRRDRERAAK